MKLRIEKVEHRVSMENRRPSTSFKDLIVWQKAHQAVLAVYKETENFPREELYGLTSQIRRSSVSVAANIAEGFKKKGPADKVRFLNIAQGSLSETEYYLLLSKDLGYSTMTGLQELVEEVSKLLVAYSRTIIKK